ncbi:MAG: hypothetical protein CVV59_01000 [Tenericutes bacterium HGW-Tenericutes-4]|jgi:predicted RNase H-like HicB family nuclease|nr:MAG: hypothetical protein CVV59_01000 [Tenericutes bacterium HGW-Tenericutes-4]
MKFQFPAILKYDETNVVNVFFPDLLGVFTFGATREEAIFMAKDVLQAVLLSMEELKTITPTPIDKLKQKFNDVVLVEVDA